MEEWKSVHIGDLGTIVTGKTPKTSIEDNYGGDTPFLSPSDDLSGKYVPITGRTLSNKGVSEVKNCLLPPQSVCVSCIGSDLGKSVITRCNTITNQQFNSIIPSNGFDTDFVYYAMQFVGPILNALSKTSTAVPIINKSTFSSFQIRVPDYSTQCRISRVLSALDDKTELNNRINHNLEEQAQALYKSWFVDFEPFMDGKFVESELGMIPEGWDAKPLSSICHIEKKTINPQKHPTCLFTHYSIPAYDNSELPELQKGSDILSNKYIISDYTILFSKLNPRIKRIWNVYQSESNPICSTEFVVYKPMDIDTYPFLYSFITGDDFYNNIMSKVNGATGSHQRFHPEETLDILVPYHIDCYRLYSQLVLPIIQQIDENKRENHYFASLRDSLLPKLMSGELKINDLTC